MDNRIFNVNGSGDDMLLATLKLVFAQTDARCKGWASTPKGLVLAWHVADKITPLPASNGLSAEEIIPLVTAWLKSDQAASIQLDGWDSDADHDGSNSLGWRVFCDDWGKAAGFYSAICCITPAFMWHGK